MKAGKPRRNRGVERVEAGRCDITSLCFHRHGQFAFGLTLHGHFVPPATHTMVSIAPTSQPEPDASSSFATIGLDGDSMFGDSGGLRVDFSNEVRGAALEVNGRVAAPSQANAQNEGLEPIRNAPIHANFEFGSDFPSQVDNLPLQTGPHDQEEHYEANTNDAFLNSFNFPPEVEITPLHRAFEQTNENYQTTINGPLLSDQANPNGDFGFNGTDQETNFDETADFPTFSQETSFSNDLSFFHNAEFNPNGPSTSPEIRFSFSDSLPSSSQESSFSTTTASSPDTLVTTPSSTATSPDRSICSICHSTFKRAGDLKRHERVHFPGQRNFHCKESGCDRKGRKGFYRRDKLRAHERQVHGMDN